MAHEPVACAGCGGALVDAVEVGVEVRQVFDLPPIRAHVIEYRLVRRRCLDCGATTAGAAPSGVTAPVQYGPRVTAAVTYLTVGQFVPRQRCADTITELFGIPISPGTVTAMTDRAAAGSPGRGC